MIRDKLKLVMKTKGVSNKFSIIKYFLTKKMDACAINISERNSIFVREGKPNDMFMALESDKEFFQYVKESKFKRIIDVGANIGKYSLLFSENKDSKVVSFEPIHENFVALLNNVGQNKAFNINPILLGCYDENKEVEINLCEENSGAHSIHFDRGYKKDKINVVTLDSFLEDRDFNPDFIKIDVEGVELNVLKGAIETIKKDKPVIFLEIFNEKEEIFNLLEGLGYTIQDKGGSNYLAKPKDLNTRDT